MDRVDLHNHYLPGVDDGPQTLLQCVEILRRAHAEGTRTMVATPHMFLPPFELVDLIEVQNRFAALVAELIELGRRGETSFLGGMTFLLGAENFVSPSFLEALAEGRVLTLDGTRNLLVEFSTYQALPAIESAIGRIREAGFSPVLAHIERYPCLFDYPRRLERLVAGGCRCQVNGLTVLGAQGRRTRRRAFKLLQRGLAHVVASDAHDDELRPPCLGPVAAALARRFDDDRARRWTSEAPRQLLGAPASAAGGP